MVTSSDSVLEIIKKYVRELKNHNIPVQEVILFGSVAAGKATPASDVDIVITIKESDRRFIDRSLRFLGYFSEADLGVDIFAYTLDELGKNPRIPRIRLC